MIYMKDIQKTLKKKKQKKHVRQDKRTGKKHVREQKRTSKKYFKKRTSKKHVREQKRTSKKHVRQEKRTSKKRKHKIYVGGANTAEIKTKINDLLDKINGFRDTPNNADDKSNLIVIRNSGKPDKTMNERLEGDSKNQCFWISFVNGLREKLKTLEFDGSDILNKNDIINIFKEKIRGKGQNINDDNKPVDLDDVEAIIKTAQRAGVNNPQGLPTSYRKQIIDLLGEICEQTNYHITIHIYTNTDLGRKLNIDFRQTLMPNDCQGTKHTINLSYSHNGSGIGHYEYIVNYNETIDDYKKRLDHYKDEASQIIKYNIEEMDKAGDVISQKQHTALKEFLQTMILEKIEINRDDGDGVVDDKDSGEGAQSYDVNTEDVNEITKKDELYSQTKLFLEKLDRIKSNNEETNDGIEFEVYFNERKKDLNEQSENILDKIFRDIVQGFLGTGNIKETTKIFVDSVVENEGDTLNALKKLNDTLDEYIKANAPRESQDSESIQKPVENQYFTEPSREVLTPQGMADNDVRSLNFRGNSKRINQSTNVDKTLNLNFIFNKDKSTFTEYLNKLSKIDETFVSSNNDLNRYVMDILLRSDNNIDKIEKIIKNIETNIDIMNNNDKVELQSVTPKTDNILLQFIIKNSNLSFDKKEQKNKRFGLF